MLLLDRFLACMKPASILKARFQAGFFYFYRFPCLGQTLKAMRCTKIRIFHNINKLHCILHHWQRSEYENAAPQHLRTRCYPAAIQSLMLLCTCSNSMLARRGEGSLNRPGYRLLVKASHLLSCRKFEERSLLVSILRSPDQ